MHTHTGTNARTHAQNWATWAMAPPRGLLCLGVRQPVGRAEACSPGPAGVFGWEGVSYTRWAGEGGRIEEGERTDAKRWVRAWRTEHGEDRKGNWEALQCLK